MSAPSIDPNSAVYTTDEVRVGWNIAEKALIVV
jgi:hypothetical protein